MKAKVKFLSIILFTAIIVLTLTGCGENASYLTVINEGNRPVTWIFIKDVLDEGVYITKGNSQTFTLEGFYDKTVDGAFGTGDERGETNHVQYVEFSFSKGKTTTFAVNGLYFYFK